MTSKTAERVELKAKRLLKRKFVNQDVWSLALERVNYIYKQFDNVSVQFSGGRDSTATLMVTLEVARRLNKLPVHVVFFDEEAIPYEVEDYVRRVAAWDDIVLDWYCIPIKHRNACSLEHPHWYTWAPEDEHLWVRPMPPEAIKTVPGIDLNKKEYRASIPATMGLLYPPEKWGRTCALLGIRAQEPMRRQGAVSRRVDENYIIKHSGAVFGDERLRHYQNLWKGYPIYDWHDRDVWLAPRKFGWDYCKAYDIMEMQGIARHNQRVAPPYGEQPLQRLWGFASGFPDIWYKMVNRVPGANTAALYSRSALWAFGKREQPKDGQTWQEAIREKVELIENKNIRDQVVHRIGQEVRLHYKKTSDPLLDIVGHPDTGLSWEFLLYIAIFQDTKKRKDPITQVKRMPYDRAWELYNAQRQVMYEQRKPTG